MLRCFKTIFHKTWYKNVENNYRTMTIYLVFTCKSCTKMKNTAHFVTYCVYYCFSCITVTVNKLAFIFDDIKICNNLQCVLYKIGWVPPRILKIILWHRWHNLMQLLLQQLTKLETVTSYIGDTLCL